MKNCFFALNEMNNDENDNNKRQMFIFMSSIAE